jgi:fructosamine-3-kinase
MAATLRLSTSHGPCFAKLADAGYAEAFEAEAAGLERLREANAVNVPRVLGVGAKSGSAFLLLEWIDLRTKSVAAADRLGRELAAQHRTTQPAFGLDHDNTIGRTPQLNAPSDDWTEFFRERRLRYQLELAEGNGLPVEVSARGFKLLDRIHVLLADHRPSPSLLHGDLWGGNWGADDRGTPFIFDPAVYFGDREADLAMTRLFGGFGAAFYGAYDAEWPLPQGWQARAELYNLYYLLNHFNLFGGGYSGAVERSIDGLLRGGTP